MCWDHLPTLTNWKFWHSTKTSIANLNSEKLYLHPALQPQKPEKNLKIAFFTLIRVCLLNFVITVSQKKIKCMQVIKSPWFWYLIYLWALAAKLSFWSFSAVLEWSKVWRSNCFQGSSNLRRTQLRNNCHLDTCFSSTTQVYPDFLITPWGD